MIRRFDKAVPIWLEYGPNLYQPINNDCELKFACHLIEGDIESTMSDADREQHQRDLADYAHTKEYESTRRSRTRFHANYKKPTSKLHNMEVDQTNETEKCDGLYATL